MNKRKLRAHIAGPGLAAAITFFTLPILSAFYSVDDIGRFSMLQLAVNLSIILFSIGLHQAYVREYFESNNKPALTFVLITIPIFLLLLCFFIITITGVELSSILFDVESTSLSILAFLCILGGLYTHLTIHILRMEEKISAYAVMLFMPKLTVLVTSLIFIYYFASIDFSFLVYSLLFSCLVSVLASSYFNGRTILEAYKVGLNSKLAKSMLKFGSPLVVGGLAFWLLTAMDKIFLKEISSYSELGYYSIAVNFTAIITIFSTILLNIWNPIVYKWSSNNTPISDYTDVMKLVFYISMILWALAGVFSWILPLILPADLKQVESLFLLLIGGPILKLLSEVTKVGVGIERKSVLSIIPVVVAVIINGILNYLLIPTFGAKGAAIASLFAFYVLLVCRTELSAMVWQPFPRFKIYSVCLIYLLSSIALTEYLDNEYLRIFVWVMFLAITVYLSKNFFIKYKRIKLN